MSATSARKLKTRMTAWSVDFGRRPITAVVHIPEKSDNISSADKPIKEELRNRANHSHGWVMIDINSQADRKGSAAIIMSINIFSKKFLALWPRMSRVLSLLFRELSAI
jgi:hypothetical protein